MALFRKLFYRKPPDGLLEICERVYVFDCCFTTDIWEEENYKGYVGGVIRQLQEHDPDVSILVFNFREGASRSLIGNVLTEYDMTIMDYPRHYEGCPLLSMEVMHHFLKSSESWLSLGQQNVLLMHCEWGGWPVLAFMLAALLIYGRYYGGEQKTLDMIYKQAPREVLHMLSPLNPIPSQLRYLQYVSRRNVASEWPPLDRALTLDCVIIRMIPDFDGEGGCQPMFRIYGQDPFLVADQAPKVLFSTPKKSKTVRHYKKAECQLVKIDINCHIQGDVVLECVNLEDDMEREVMMFRIMFNTAFIRSNILMLNRDEIDTLWDVKDQFPKNFRVEVLFSEMDAAASMVPVDLSCFEEKDGLPVEAFAKVQEMFSNVDWLVPKDDAALNVLQQISASNLGKEKLESDSHLTIEGSKLMKESSAGEPEDVKRPSASVSIVKNLISLTSEKQSPSSPKLSPQAYLDKQKNNKTEAVVSPAPSVSQSENSFIPSKENSHTFSSPPLLQLSDYRHSVEKMPASIQQESSDADLSHPTPACETTPSKSIGTTPPPPPPVPGKDSDAGSTSAASPSAMQMPPLTPSLEEERVITSGPPTLAPPLPSPPRVLSHQDLPLKDNTSSMSEANAPHPSKHVTSISQKNDMFIGSEAPPPAPPISSPLTQDTLVETKPLPSPSLPTLSPSTPPLKHIRSRPPPPPFPLTPPNPPTPPLGETSCSRIRVPPPPPAATPPLVETSCSRVRVPPPPPPPPALPPKENSSFRAAPPPPLPPPLLSVPAAGPTTSLWVPPPPPPAPSSSIKQANPISHGSSNIPSAPPPPIPSIKRDPKVNGGLSHSRLTGKGGHASSSPPPPSIPPPGTKGKPLPSHAMTSKNHQTKKLKPLHWLKLSRAVQGSLWAEAPKTGEATRTPEIDISELESLFSAVVPNSDHGGSGRRTGSRALMGQKSEKVQLIEHRRAYNCEIMLSKVKIPLHDLLSSVLALEDSGLDVDQVENLIKFCPTKEEMDMLKGYKGDKDKLGKCEQFFLELMQVPRIENKLRVFSFKMQFRSQVSDVRSSLNVVNSATDQIRGSTKLKRVMQTILSLGNALNQGTARGSAIGFRLDSLLKLTDTRARNNKMTLMHYLCKVLADKLPELLDFGKDLSSLEPASKIQLKFLAEEMQAISKGLEKIVQELSTSENDGPVSDNFRKVLKEFLCFAEGEVRSLASLYSGVGRNVDALILYFGEDPSRNPFEQVVSTLLNFVRMFNRAHEENCKQLEFERKKAEKEAAMEKLKSAASEKEPGQLTSSPVRSVK